MIPNSTVAKENPTKKNLVKKNTSIIPQSSTDQGCGYLEGSKQSSYMYERSLFVVWPLYDMQSKYSY